MARTLAATFLLVALIAAGLSFALPARALDEVDPASLTAPTLMATLPTLGDLVPVEPAPQNWWPGLPSASAVTGPNYPAGLRLIATQRFSREPGYASPAYMDITLLAFKNRESAHAAFRAHAAAVSAAGAHELRGPDLVNARRYYAAPASGGMFTAEADYRNGFLVVFLSLVSAEGPISAGDMGKLARPILDKVQALRYGQITTPALPADFDKLLPPPRVEFEVGPVTNSLALAPQVWALRGPGSPESVMRRITAAGVSLLYYRTYTITLLPGHTMQVTLFPCKDAQAASALVQPFREIPRNGASALPAGATGPQSALRFSPATQSYELQFAKGIYAADVIATGPPGGQADLLCQIFVRLLAERWYAALPSPLVLGNE